MTIEVVETAVFQRWMNQLKDAVAKTRILARLRRASMGTQNSDIGRAIEIASQLKG